MANTLTGLLKGQTIRIDNHHRGIPNIWNKDNYEIHIDKFLNNKNTNYSINIIVNREQVGPIIEPFDSNIRREIRRAVKDKQKLDDFYANIYKYLTDNFGWDGNRSEEDILISNIAKTFDIMPFKSPIEVTNAKTQKRNVMQLLQDNNIHYHVSFNYSKQCVYIGQFQFGDMTSIYEDAQHSWAETLEENLRDILAAPDMKAKLSVLAKQTPRIGKKVVDTTLDSIERIFGDKPDITDEKTR